MSQKVQKINNLRTVNALRGQSLTIDLGKTLTGTLTAWMKRSPTDSTYRSFTVVDGRYLFLPKEKAQDLSATDVVEGRWYFDVRHLPVGSVDPNDEQMIFTGTIDFSNHITDSNGTEVATTPEAESGMIALSNTSSVYGTPGQIVKAKDLIANIAEVRTIKAMRAVALTIDLKKEYPDHKLEAWMKKDPNGNTYRSFDIVDQRYLFLSKEKTQDYYDIVTNELIEPVAGKWYFDVRAIPNAATNPNDEEVIVKGVIFFEDNVTDSIGQELVSNARPYANEFVQLFDTPSDYTGFGDYFVRVNTAEDGLRFEQFDVTEFEEDITISTSQISDFDTIIQDKNYIHTQIAASSAWNVNHGLGKHPNVSVVDSGENQVVGDVLYVDLNNVTITFSASFSGRAYFN